MLNIKYKKSFSIKVAQIITMTLGFIIFVVGICLGIFFFTFTIWVDKNIKEVELKIKRVKKI